MLINQGIWTRIAKKLYIFVIFQGGGGSDPLPPPLWIRACGTMMKTMRMMMLVMLALKTTSFVLAWKQLSINTYGLEVWLTHHGGNTNLAIFAGDRDGTA